VTGTLPPGSASDRVAPAHAARAFEVLAAFLALGLRSFGGPIAHLGYFRAEFVGRRRWLDAGTFAELIALCQFLPGPASSQVGFSIGLLRAGYAGALAAWIGFTLPSALAMIALAAGVQAFTGPLAVGALHGLRLVAVAIVAQALWSMARALTPDRNRLLIAAAALILLLELHSALAQVGVLAAGALAGLWLCRATARLTAAGAADLTCVGRGTGRVALAAYALLLVGLPIVAAALHSQGLALFDAFYRAGALVFGGGHVVLPLLHETVVASGWLNDSAFLAGYGAAQALPGPLFTFAAYLGAMVGVSPHGLPGALLALAGIFLPGMLILTGVLPFWASLRRHALAGAGIQGINAVVVGLLAAALYNPIWTTAVMRAADVPLVAAALVMLIARVPVVAAGAIAGSVLG